MSTLDELRIYIETLETRIKTLEDRTPVQEFQIQKQQEFLPSYDILKVYKLIANLPIYTVARAETPDNGEIWLSDISGTRKLNARISGVTYSATIT